MNAENAVRQRIIDLCSERGITVNALSVQAGMPRSTLKNIIQGRSKTIAIITIQIVCDTLDITLFDFFGVAMFRSIDPI